MKPKRILSASVRDVVSFVLQGGDLGGSGQFAAANRALEGTRGHQRIQKSRPAGYEPEVALNRKIETADFIFELKGRIDGVHVQNSSLLIEEIKTSDRPWVGPAHPLHWAQAKLYACIYAQDHGFLEADVQITYLELDSLHIVEFRETFSTAALAEFFQEIVGEYVRWLTVHYQWCELRDRSIEPLPFPFANYRAGQRSLAVAVYRAVQSRGRLFAEAPTGIGKTVSALFPAIKAMGQGSAEKIFYLTAKTVGRTVAEKTLADLRSAGLRLRSVTLTAKDKICFNNGQPCDMKSCPFAIGYYDRIKGALRDSFEHPGDFTRAGIEGLARRHNVCPFELSLDLSVWSDAIICDYNYVFDPSVSLKRYFSEEKQNFAILIDESHNLLDRAREMFSADLHRGELFALERTLSSELPACARALRKVASRLKAIEKEEEWADREGTLVRKTPPETLAKAVKQFLHEAELWLVENSPAEFREALLDCYFGSQDGKV